MRLAVYSALYGNRDPLNPDCMGDGAGYDRFLFTDRIAGQGLTGLATGIGTVQDPLMGLDAPRASRRAKLMPHRYFPEYDWSLYLDNTARLLCDPVALVTGLAAQEPAQGFFCFSHAERDCAYDEADACLRARRDDPARIRSQIGFYRAEGYPAHQGLIQGTVLIRRHGARDWATLGERWFEQILVHSRRDQLSFGYVAWKMGLQPSLLPGTLLANDIAAWPVLLPNQRHSDKLQTPFLLRQRRKLANKLRKFAQASRKP